MSIKTALAIAVAMPLGLAANNIQVSSVILTGQNTGSDTWQVQFDISWENSWRASTGTSNYDAAWVFIKYRFGPNTDWRHATLSSTGHVAPAGSTIAPPSDLKGAFIHRNANGMGNVNFIGVQLRWNYAGTGISDTDPIEIRVLAVEMVFVPQGAFALGDGTTTDVNRQYELAQTGAPFIVSSEAAITLGGPGAASLNIRNAAGFDFNYTTTQTLPAAFPKGFNAFYAMKYELSEGQYVDFLNLLTPTQATARFPNQTGNVGHTIDDTGVAPNPYLSTAPDRACAFISWNSLQAYADWSALRPMSDMEYEKLARGTMPAIANERAWGSTTLSTVVLSLTSPGTANEVVTNPGSGALANYSQANTGADQRPWRVAAIPASIPAPTRQQASAGYYGANELSGNVAENYINPCFAGGRTMDRAVMGDGNLTAAGNADAATWSSGNGTFMFRGGHYASSETELRISDRIGPSYSSTMMSDATGGRLCRMP